MNSVSVNGVNIMTDKPGLSMTGEVIVFSDGSTYNTRTGAFNNAGPGDVYVDGKRLDNSVGSSQAKPQEEPSFREESFATRRLTMKIRSANVTVVNNEGDSMRVEISGPRALIDAVKLDGRGDTLTITEESTGSGGSTYVIGNGNVMISSFSSISIGGRGGTNVFTSNGGIVSIKVSVPYRTPVDVAITGSGDVNIDGVDGPLNAQIRGSGDVYASGASGNVIADIAGSGDIRIDQGQVDMLAASIAGSGDIKFGGTARNANLNVRGSGDIRVEHVINLPVKNVRGSGDIRVYRVG